MTTHDLFRCIGDLSDEFIEEAAEIKRKSRWLPIAALAACAALAISIPLVLHGGQKSASTAADTSAAVECPAEDASLSENETTADAPAAGAEAESDGSWYDSDPTAARILATEIGGLRLGMTEAEILDIAGPADDETNGGIVDRGDGIQEICWFYNTSGSTEVLHDTSLAIAGTDLRGGSDAVLSEIRLSPLSTWTLDTGIGIGSPQEAVDAAYPDASFASGGAENTWIYSYTAGDLYLRIIVKDGEVSGIDLGGLHEYHFPDENEPAPSDPYTFTPYDTLFGDPVTAYLRTNTGWEKRVLTGKPAKRIITALNIMDPEPSDRIAEPVLWLEFPSGGAAALYGDDSSGAIYRIEDAAAFETALESGEDPTASLTLIESCIFPDAWDDIQTALAE